MEPSEVEPADEMVSFAPSSDSPLGESYDSVSTEDTASEWLLRATESGPPAADPERRPSEPVTLPADDDDGVEEGLEGVPASFFESEGEEVKFESEDEEVKFESEDEVGNFEIEDEERQVRERGRRKQG